MRVLVLVRVRVLMIGHDWSHLASSRLPRAPIPRPLPPPRGKGRREERVTLTLPRRWEDVRRRHLEESLPGAPWPAARDKLALARAMRRQPTPSERRLWEGLRGRRLGFRFRRQHVIAGYIVDFYSPEFLLAVEVDGTVHDARGSYDRERDAHLATLGVAVLRFHVDQVNHQLPAVLRAIADSCVQRSPLPPRRGKGPGDGGSGTLTPENEDTDPNDPSA